LNVLGFQAGEKMGPGQIVKAGELMIYLEPGTGKGVADPKGRSGFSPCLAVDSVKQSYDRLVETGVTILEPYREFAPDFGFFRLADPDGFAIEIAGHP
jgi:predicted enzyme related to lactoylglutathione lyase